MILQALNEYYARKMDELPEEGFELKEIPFLLVIDTEGRFAGMRDTRTLSGKKTVARKFMVPKGKDRTGKNAWQTANLLWDHYGYVLGFPKSEKQADCSMARRQHESFISRVGELCSACPEDRDVLAVHKFLTEGKADSVFHDPSWPECEKIPGCNLSFSMEEKNQLVCENESVKAHVRSLLGAGEADDECGDEHAREAVCLVSGVHGRVARLHQSTFIPGAKSTAKLVSFQKNMGFDSYGREQSYNAPVSEKAAFGYATALNHLLSRNSRQKIRLANDTIVFWAEKDHEIETVFIDLFGEPGEGEPEQDYKQLVAMFRSPETGAAPNLDPETRFFVLGLSPNAARIAVRFWYAGTVGAIADNIMRHFEDIDMISREKNRRSLSLRNLLRATAFGVKREKKDENIPPNLAGDTMKAILTGLAYPSTLLSAAVRRCRAEQEVNFARAALIKAVLVRDYRLGTRFHGKEEKEVNMSIDLENINVGYRLGRLFALLEKIQEEANPGINATIRDRFYGSASATPVSSFPHLMKLKNHHIAK
ncbi:MAG: type I-C CRISPR-associated protein Cas8c/Csd1, partial [Pseudomonadota bacterium]